MHRKLSDDVIEQIRDMRRKGMSYRDIGTALGIHHSTPARYCESVDTVDSPPDNLNEIQDNRQIDGTISIATADKPLTESEMVELCNVDLTRWVVDRYKVSTWQSYYRNQTRTGHTKVPLFQTTLHLVPLVEPQFEKALKDFVERNIAPLPPPKRRKKRAGEFALAWGFWDAHLGMYAWGQETIGQDYDIDIATRRMRNSVDDMIEELKPYSIDRIWMPIGNDFLHADNKNNTTTAGTPQDLDTRHALVMSRGLEILCYKIDRALEICDRIEPMYVPGNHDYQSSFGLILALKQRYRNDPRVLVDVRANPRKYRTFGGTLLGFHHGNDIRPDMYPSILGIEAQKEWSGATYREVQIGHRHQRSVKKYLESVQPTNGVILRMNPCLCPRDAWHSGHGYMGEPMQSVEAWRYDKVGYRGSHVTWARDE